MKTSSKWDWLMFIDIPSFIASKSTNVAFFALTLEAGENKSGVLTVTSLAALQFNLAFWCHDLFSLNKDY